MKSTEIRQKLIDEGFGCGPTNGPEATKIYFLGEIAAQLAELNENYREFKKLYTTNGAIDVCSRGS